MKHERSSRQSSAKAKKVRPGHAPHMIADLVTDKIPPVIDVPPPPPQPADFLLGEPIYHIETAWQSIIKGMKDRDLAVRIYSPSDRSNLYKTAARMGFTVLTRRTTTQIVPDGPQVECWIAQLTDKNAVKRAESSIALDVLVPFARGTRGHYRALALMVLERGSLSFTEKTDAEKVHHSLRRFIWRNKLTKRHQHNAVLLKQDAEAPAKFKVSVADSVRESYTSQVAEQGNKKKPKQ